jgi:hypothetical protein
LYREILDYKLYLILKWHQALLLLLQVGCTEQILSLWTEPLLPAIRYQESIFGNNSGLFAETGLLAHRIDLIKNFRNDGYQEIQHDNVVEKWTKKEEDPDVAEGDWAEFVRVKISKDYSVDKGDCIEDSASYEIIISSISNRDLPEGITERYESQE